VKNAGLEDDMPNNRAAESTGRTKSCRAFRQVVSFFQICCLVHRLLVRHLLSPLICFLL